MVRTVPLYIIRGFSLYTQQWYMSYRFADSLRAGSGWKRVPFSKWGAHKSLNTIDHILHIKRKTSFVPLYTDL